MPAILQVAHLTKQFDSIKAVDDLSFAVERGEVYGFLGQNGAGKSTTIRMLLTLVHPTSGKISLFGKDLFRHRQQVLRQTGAVVEKPDLYTYLTAMDNLRMMARLSGLQLTGAQLLRQLEVVGLASRSGDKVRTYSQGMKQRLGIACALVHNPQLIILDEPTNGLDPQGIADMRNLVRHLSRNEGKTVFVSSHLLSEIELVADSMLIIDKGRKIREGSVATLLNPALTIVSVQTNDDEHAKSILQQSAWGAALQEQEQAILLHMHAESIPRLAAFLVAQGVGIRSLQQKHSLEDYFLSLTNGNRHVDDYKD